MNFKLFISKINYDLTKWENLKSIHSSSKSKILTLPIALTFSKNIAPLHLLFLLLCIHVQSLLPFPFFSFLKMDFEVVKCNQFENIIRSAGEKKKIELCFFPISRSCLFPYIAEKCMEYFFHSFL